MCRMKRILRYVVPMSPGSKDQIGILGSAALHWYQDERAIGPKWNVPNDIDLFVAGRWGNTTRLFILFVHRTLKRLTRAGYYFAVEYKKNRYAVPNRIVHIVDVKITGLELTLSFVQSPCCANLREVANAFDIDVCRVIYLIHSCSFVVDKKVQKSIEAGRATVNSIAFCSRSYGGRITHVDRSKVLSSMVRINKYLGRGFVLTNSGGVAFTR